MSAVGQHRITLQEHPSYKDGFEAWALGKRGKPTLTGQEPDYETANAAWALGYADAKEEDKDL
jgi:hypothetical protein